MPIRIDRAQQPLLREQDFFPAENAGERHPRITRERGREVTAVNDLCAFVGGAVIDDRELQQSGCLEQRLCLLDIAYAGQLNFNRVP